MDVKKLLPAAAAADGGPLPRADAETRGVWFDERGVGVEMHARDASVRRA